MLSTYALTQFNEIFLRIETRGEDLKGLYRPHVTPPIFSHESPFSTDKIISRDIYSSSNLRSSKVFQSNALVQKVCATTEARRKKVLHCRSCAKSTHSHRAACSHAARNPSTMQQVGNQAASTLQTSEAIIDSERKNRLHQAEDIPEDDITTLTSSVGSRPKQASPGSRGSGRLSRCSRENAVEFRKASNTQRRLKDLWTRLAIVSTHSPPSKVYKKTGG